MSDDAKVPDRVERLEKRLEREKRARKEAEILLEEKSRELYALNSSLDQKAENLEKKLSLLESVAVNANDAVIITDANLESPGPTIVYVNEAFTRISGYSASEALGKSPRFLQGNSTDKKTLAALRRALEQGENFKGELKNYGKKGGSYWLDISVSPVKDESGKVTHFVAIERDISQRKAFEKTLLVNREAAEVANRAKSDFLANISHELRTPMNGIIGLSELLMDMNLSQDQLELAEAVNMSSRNLLILLNDILDLSKIEASELSLEKIPYDIRRIVRQTADLLEPIASRKGISLESVISPTLPERLNGDPARLQQILNNLIGNALKFTEKGYVRLDVSAGKDKTGILKLRIRVEDTGIGIAEDQQEAIFNKFTQADVSTARKYGGTGLGLTIVRELVTLMRGEITLDSALGKGSSFHVEIPVEVAEAEQNASGEVARQAPPVNMSARLMIVDDHPVNLLFMRKVLKKIGFARVDEAESGKQALELYGASKYDLIFMDCQMPEMDGFEASAKIREIEDFANQTKIIAVTADAMKGARERCIDAGMNDYISKPIDVEKLKAVLGEWLPGEGKTVPQSPEAHSTALGDNAFPVMDWERLRMFTDGNKEEEKELIALFVSYAEESVNVLIENCEEGSGEAWKKAAHKLKGSAANLGALALSEICYEAEQAHEAAKAEKEIILKRLLASYAAARSALESGAP